MARIWPLFVGTVKLAPRPSLELPNPLITAKEVATTWYVSFSFDVDVGRIFR